MKLKDRVAIITGAGSGIGKAQALLFAQEGAIVIAIDMSLDNVSKVAEQIKETNENVLPLPLDVTDEQGVKNALEKVIDTYGKIDILSNTAGLLDGYAPSLDTTTEVWDKVMNVNVRAVFTFTNAVLPHMLKNKRGSIINITSVGAFVAGAGGAAYTTSKHAILGYTRQLTLDYAKEGIRVNAIAPGLIETPMNKDFFENKEASLKIIQSIPARRAGKAEEIAKAALFLASEDAEFIYGSTIVVDGGSLVALNGAIQETT